MPATCGSVGASSRAFCVRESFLLVLERSSIELREPGYGLAQLGIEFQRLLEGCSSLVRRALFFVSVSQAHLGNNIVRLLFRHRLELRDRQFGRRTCPTVKQGETLFALVFAF